MEVFLAFAAGVVIGAVSVIVLALCLAKRK